MSVQARTSATTGIVAWFIAGSAGDIMGRPTLQVLAGLRARRRQQALPHGRRTRIPILPASSASFWDTLGCEVTHPGGPCTMRRRSG